MRGYYINLDRSKERRDSFEKNLRSLSLEEKIIRYPAIDGKTYEDIDKGEGNWKNLLKAQRGLWITFENILRDNIGSDDHLLIFEDDTVIGKNFSKAYEWILNSTPKDGWDRIDFNCMLNIFDIRIANRVFEQFRKIKSQKSHVIFEGKALYAYGTSALLINKRSISKLYQLMRDGRKYGLATDRYFSELFKNELLTSLILFPFPCRLNNHYKESTISDYGTVIEYLIQLSNSFFLEEINENNPALSIDFKEERAREIYTQLVEHYIKSDPTEI